MALGARMVALVSLSALTAVAAGPAFAQPGQSPPSSAPPPPPQQQQLTHEERELLLRGEISTGQHVAGAAVAFFVPFGLGQAVQGRYTDTGYIFTIGETGSILVTVAGMPSCVTSEDGNDCTVMLLGIAGIAVFRIWELVDAIVGPMNHNQKVRAVRYKLQGRPGWSGFVLPSARGDGAVGGLQLRF